MVASNPQNSSSSFSSGLRYTLLTFHFILWVVPFLLNIFLSGSIILLILHCCIGIAILIYVPAAIILSAKNSSNSFDHAGGEIAYASVQLVAHLVSAIIAFLSYGFSSTCHHRAYRYQTFIPIACPMLIVIGVLSIVQLILMAIWITWLVRLAGHTPGYRRSQAYMIPAHQLINGSWRSTAIFGMQSGSGGRYSQGGQFDEHTAFTYGGAEAGVGAPTGQQNPFVSPYEPVEGQQGMQEQGQGRTVSGGNNYNYPYRKVEA